MEKISDEDSEKLLRMNIIYKALEDGWCVKKSDTGPKTFEFTKNKSIDKDYKGLVIFSKNDVCRDIENHLTNCSKGINEKKTEEMKRSVSSPILKNIQKFN